MNEYGAMSVRCTVLANRAEKHSDKFPMSAAAHNE